MRAEPLEDVIRALDASLVVPTRTVAAATAAAEDEAAAAGGRLGAGLVQRVMIAQATGQLMARYDVGAEGALSVLTRVAESRHCLVLDVATALVSVIETERVTGETQLHRLDQLGHRERRPQIGIQYERFFAEPPSRVFAVLIGLLAVSGRLHSIEGYGRHLTFATSRCSVEHVCTLRGWVNEWHGGTLLQVQATGREVLTEEQDDAEVTRLMTLLGAVADRLEAEGAREGAHDGAHDGAGAVAQEPDH